MSDYALAGLALIMLVGALVGAAAGTSAVALFLPALLLGGVWLLHSKMTTTVYEDCIVVEFGWLRLKLMRFAIPLAEVKSCRPMPHGPLGAFVGGLRGQFAVFMCRSKAVEVEVVTTKRIFLRPWRILLIGTGLPHQLSDAINRLLPPDG